ncbi:WecB/TagA/CpsF family glycosyltransferase [Streptococcus suis]|nr:WecB/TagA/CpsF family glycosyltransferase [Streptococcus suis]
MNKSIEILGVKIHPLTASQTLNAVEGYILEKRPLHLMGVNADKINLCQSDSELMRIVNECEITNADGASVVLAGKYLGLDIPERVAGIDLMQDLLKLCESKGYSVYFFGAKQDVLEEMLKAFQETYPNLKISGARNGYFSDDDLGQIGEEIRRLQPEIVFVGITSPKKEYIVDHFLKNGINSVYMGVGGSFDVLSGKIPRAPKWMQKSNLEWLFRVMNEPRRLFKRYFIGNTTFINRIIKEKRSKK